MTLRSSLILALLVLGACTHGPSRDEARAAIRASNPALDTATVYARVWQDGPPWFSCAEVLAKLDKSADSAAVRDALRPWRPLILHDWIVLRDSASGPVADPGWCTARVTGMGKPHVSQWAPIAGPYTPTGKPRRGWMVLVGRRQLAVSATHGSRGADSATADYLVTVATNADGAAVGADRDTARFVAALRRVDGEWRVVGSRRAADAQ